MFTTNAVQTGTVPTLQYQEHPTQKSQGKNIENVQQKNAQQTQQSQQQQVFIYFITINTMLPKKPFIFKLTKLCISYSYTIYFKSSMIY